MESVPPHLPYGNCFSAGVQANRAGFYIATIDVYLYTVLRKNIMHTWIHRLWRFLFVLASAGFFFSLVVHLSAFTGILLDIFASLSPGLHIGIFVVFIPALAAVMQSDSYRQLQKRGTRRFRDLLHIMVNPSPTWMKVAIIICLVYAIGNFVLYFFFRETGEAVKIAGRYLLIEEGEVIRRLSEQEYWFHRSHVIRGYSGHWMFFYILSMTILHAQSNKPVRRE
jgi:hypothetical protein